MQVAARAADIGAVTRRLAATRDLQRLPKRLASARRPLAATRASADEGRNPKEVSWMTCDIVVGIDGTGLRWDDGSNVAKIVAAAGACGARTIYRRGVGSVARNRFRGGIAGRGVNRQIRRTWQDVCAKYRRGDRIWIVGYSRGGAAAISLANMIGAVGLPKCGVVSECAHEAMDAYGARPGLAGAARFKFRDLWNAWDSFPNRVHMLGVFDPVAALGKVWPGRLSRLRFGQHDMTPREHVRGYFAIMAGLERRAAFWPVLQTTPEAGVLPERPLRQIWMPGVHGDIGGGEGQPMAEVAFLLMMRAMADAGLRLPPSSLGELPENLPPATESVRGVYRLMRKKDRPQHWRDFLPCRSENYATIDRGRPWADRMERELVKA